MRLNSFVLYAALTVLLAQSGGCGRRSPSQSTRGVMPTQQEIENLSYRSAFTRSGRAQLVEGHYREPMRGNAGMLQVSLSPTFRILGALNEHQDGAAVILRTVPGTSQRGEFYDLAAVVKTDTVVQNVAIASLGDRIQIRAVLLENGLIVVDMLVHGPKGRSFLPSVPLRRSYRLQGDKLVLVKTEELEE